MLSFCNDIKLVKKYVNLFLSLLFLYLSVIICVIFCLSRKRCDMKKKTIVIIGLILLLVICLVPKRDIYKDGGTIKYSALTYEIVKYHELNSRYSSGYKTGWQIKILGFLVYDKVEYPDKFPDNDTQERVIQVNNQLYFEVESEKKDFNYCGTDFLDGKIISHIDFSKLPTENDQANFSGDYDYMFVSKKVIMACSSNETLYFKLKEVPSSEEIIDGNLDIDSSFVEDLYRKANPSEDASILKEIYGNDHSFSNSYILSVALVNLIREKNLQDEEYIKQEDVEEQIYDFFGSNISFQHQKVFLFYSNEYGRGVCGYSYLEEQKQYQLMHGCGGNWYEFFERRLISAEKQGDYVYLTEKSIYCTNDWDDVISRVTVYNNYAREKKLNYFEKSSYESTDVLLDDYIEQASTYIYTFKQQNDHYILESIKSFEN